VTTLFSKLLRSAQGDDGRMILEVPEDWMQGRSVFGGLQIALALRAMRSLAPELPLRTVQATFVAPAAGRLDVRAGVLRRSKSTVHAEARIVDGDAQITGDFNLGLKSSAMTAGTGGDRRALLAAYQYLVLGTIGATFYIIGVGLLYLSTGTLNLADLALRLRDVHEMRPVLAALAFITAGLGLKLALFPLHFWLPPAHAQAPAPVSAALSALVVKAAFYLVLRLWIDLFAPTVGPHPAILLGVLGAAGVIWGSWRAFRAERLKLLAAYSTVAQVGYLFLFFPLMAAAALPRRQELLGALLLLALTHGFAKAGLFLAIGIVQHHSGHDTIRELDGTAQRLPATTFAMALGGVALIGLPPSGAFLGKWQLLAGAVATGQWLWAVVTLIGSLLAAAYIFRVLGHAFGHQAYPNRAVTVATEEWPALLLTAMAAVVLGLAGAPVWRLLEIGL